MREFSLEQLAAFVARHAPVFRLHPSDRFMPCTAEYFMAHSTLVAETPSGSGRAELLPRGSVTAEALLDAQRRHPAHVRLVLELDPAARRGTPQSQIDNVPLYAHVKEVLAPAGQHSAHSGHGSGVGHSAAGGGGAVAGPAVEALEINYLTFYAYNGPYNVGGVRLVQTGAHDGDWEHITARVHPSTGELLGMWYNAHRSRDGMWVEPHRVPRTPEGRPIAYVALHGHGVYPMAGTIPRHFFLGNDKCSGAGPLWAPHTVVLLPPVHEDPTILHAGHAGHDAHTPHHQPRPPGSPVRLDQAPAASPRVLSEALATAAAVAETEQSGSVGKPEPVSTIGLAGQQAGLQQDGDPGRQAASQAADLGHIEAAAAAVLGQAGNGPAGPALSLPRTRRLQSAHSRGSSIGSSGSSNGGAALGPAANWGSSWTPLASSIEVRVVTDDPCLWVYFRGLWGQTDAPIIQPWFHTAEPPLSRNTLLRLFGHFWPEKQRVG